MTDIPIIFSAPMVRALLDGRKTQTRRLAWAEACVWMPRKGDVLIPGRGLLRPTCWQNVEPGDRLWVRETFWGCDFRETGELPIVVYAERHHGKTYDRPGNVMIAAPKFGHIPAIHMPRKASRLTLVVTDARIEPLQMMSSSDGKAEGMLVTGYTPQWHEDDPRRYVLGFQQNWESLHGDGAWDENPEVVALTFTVHKSNIDAMERAA